MMVAIGKKLTDGLYGKLEFDFACNRGHAFGEHYLHGVMNEILASSIDPHVLNLEPDYAAPELQTPGNAGRNREVDFALINHATGAPVTFIEAKWAGSTHCKSKTILRDVARLATLSLANPGATCLFVLAGGKDKIARLLNTGLLASQKNLPGRRLLSYPYHSYARSFSFQRYLSASASNDLASRLPRVPESVSSLLYKPAHEGVPNWRVLVWRIR